ncbi:MAG: DRTGG domain-containing protein [Atribacterota bacterium]|nr:DRTGG domain-containing protein [Atribacterota bacterium]MDD4895295.1 DRTGG domain-containing protein [Atribacterota bacterium]MDD5636619.1 DRTGG domain-containing protein [Atribacterota bacterium]
MKLSQIIVRCSLQKIVFCSDEEIKTGYCGDLMSDVIAHASNDSVWITIQAHKNSIAVALIKDIRAIIFTNNVEINQELIEKAREEQINLLRTEKNSFQICGLLYQMLGGKSDQD